MTLRNAVLTTHIFFAIVVIGWLAMHSMLVPGAIRKGQAGFVRFGANAAAKIGPTATVVFLLGIWLVLRDGDDGIDFSDAWVSASMLLYIVTAVIGAVFIGKAELRAADKLDAGQDASDEARTVSILGGVSTVLLLVIVYLMVAKPGGF